MGGGRRLGETSRREFLRAAAGSAVALSTLGASTGRESSRPNIVLIVTDDVNARHLSFYGGLVQTPNIDRLAREGAYFSNAFTSSSVCTPARYTCLTGRYAGRARLLDELTPPSISTYVRQNTPVEPDAPHLVKLLGSAGYTTGHVGKWAGGLGWAPGDYVWSAEQYLVRRRHANPMTRWMQSNPLPPGYHDDSDPREPALAAWLTKQHQYWVDTIRRRYGFDYAANVVLHNLVGGYVSPRSLRAHNMEWVTQGALEFIDEHRDRAFFLHFSPTLMHSPPAYDRLATPRGMLDEPIGLFSDTRRLVALDRGIGAIIDRLETHGLLDRTLVVFCNDQDIRGKGTCFDSGVRVPLFLRWGERIPAARRGELVSYVDIVPTLLDAAGIDPPSDVRLDGQSLLPRPGDDAGTTRDAVFFELGNNRAVRTQRWKYIAYRHPEGIDYTSRAVSEEEKRRKDVFYDVHRREQGKARLRRNFVPDQLFDLRTDPAERVNLVGEPAHAKNLAHMRSLLAEWLSTFGHPYGEFTTAPSARSAKRAAP